MSRRRLGRTLVAHGRSQRRAENDHPNWFDTHQESLALELEEFGITATQLSDPDTSATIF